LVDLIRTFDRLEFCFFRFFMIAMCRFGGSGGVDRVVGGGGGAAVGGGERIAAY
jgi:hypothetical protein